MAHKDEDDGEGDLHPIVNWHRDLDKEGCTCPDVSFGKSAKERKQHVNYEHCSGESLEALLDLLFFDGFFDDRMRAGGEAFLFVHNNWFNLSDGYLDWFSERELTGFLINSCFHFSIIR